VGVIDLLPPLAWLAVLGALQIADWYTTVTILDGGGRELNPVMRKLMEWLGTEPALAIKGVLVIVCGAFLLPYPAALVLLVAVYAGVVAWNVWQMTKG
jgi:hypothetical protein